MPNPITCKAINADNRRNIAVFEKLNIAVNKIVNVTKR